IRREPEGAQMTRPTANTDLSGSQYTRVSGTGEGDNRARKALWVAPDAATQPKATTMYRIFTAAAVFALTISAAHADDQLATRIHDDAKAVCAKAVAHQTQPSFYYN